MLIPGEGLQEWMDFLDLRQMLFCLKMAMTSNFSKFIYTYISLFIERQSDRKGEKKRERTRDFSLCSFTHQMPTAPQGWAGPKLGAGTPFKSPTWAAGTQVLEPWALPPWICISRKLELGGELRIQRRPCGVGCRCLNPWLHHWAKRPLLSPLLKWQCAPVCSSEERGPVWVFQTFVCLQLCNWS